MEGVDAIDAARPNAEDGPLPEEARGGAVDGNGKKQVGREGGAAGPGKGPFCGASPANAPSGHTGRRGATAVNTGGAAAAGPPLSSPPVLLSGSRLLGGGATQLLAGEPLSPSNTRPTELGSPAVRADELGCGGGDGGGGGGGGGGCGETLMGDIPDSQSEVAASGHRTGGEEQPAATSAVQTRYRCLV